MRNPVRDTARIAAEAAEWLLLLEEQPTAENREAFVEWLKHSPAHMDEFLLVTAAWRAMHGVDPDRRIEVHSLPGPSAAEVLPLAEQTSQPELSPTASPRRRPFSRWISMATVTLLVAVAGAYFIQQNTTFATATGEQRTIKLPDGSVIHLNTRSRVRVDYDSTSRDIRLLRGEALFVVAEDRSRPFRVHSAGAVVQALGTQFNVYQQAQGTTISVVEGAVRVSALGVNALSRTSAGADEPARTTSELRAGEQARVTENGAILKRALADLDQTVAWRRRQLVFHAAALEEIVAEFNRYNELRIEVPDPDLAKRKLTAVFNADHPRAFLRFLETEQDLQVLWQGNAAAVRRR